MSNIKKPFYVYLSHIYLSISSLMFTYSIWLLYFNVRFAYFVYNWVESKMVMSKMCKNRKCKREFCLLIERKRIRCEYFNDNKLLSVNFAFTYKNLWNSKTCNVFKFKYNIMNYYLLFRTRQIINNTTSWRHRILRNYFILNTCLWNLQKIAISSTWVQYSRKAN